MTIDELLMLVAFVLLVGAAAAAVLRARRLERERDAFFKWLGPHTVAEIDDWRADQ